VEGLREAARGRQGAQHRGVQLPARAPDRLAKETDTVPAVNQIELHPLLTQTELRKYHAEHGIATEAWAPIAKGSILGDATLTGLAEKYGRTPAQVVLRWQVQVGNIVFPKSVNPARMRENINVFDFELTADDLAAVEALNTGQRTGPDPDTFGR
jgi:2,5-diketo-D-gluconate reductase A